MSNLDINERQVGDVTILDFDGEFRIGDASLRDYVGRLKEENKNKVVLNLADLTYIDSAGCTELVDSKRKLGGMVKIASTRPRIMDLFVVGRMIKVFEVYDSVDDAVKAFTTTPLCIKCPVYSCENRIHFYLAEPPAHITCSRCGTEIAVTPVRSGTINQMAISALFMSTYKREHISVVPGTTTIILIDGRLDLFASEILEKAWLTLPPPRRVVFHIHPSKEISPVGKQKLLDLCANRQKHSAGVIVLAKTDTRHTFPPESPVYDNEENALRVLGDGATRVPWLLDLVTVEGS